MNDKANPRDAAISAFRQREADAARISSEQAQAEQAESRQYAANLTAWSTGALGAISMGVMQVSNDFARRGSPFLIRQKPESRLGIATFEIHRSGSLHRDMALTFSLDGDGVVRAGTDARGADLPDSVAVDEVTPEWAEKVAEQVMFAVLASGQAAIASDGSGGQTSAPNQSRSGRLQRRNS